MSDEGAGAVDDRGPRAGVLRQWFGMRERVTRVAYVSGGVLFMAIKFAIERSIYQAWLGHTLTPKMYLTPIFTDRAKLLMSAPDGVAWTMIGLALPFLWLGVSMSVRRALDAGLPPTLGFAFLIPGVNYILMAALSVWPPSKSKAHAAVASAYRPAPEQEELAGAEAPSEAMRFTRGALASAAVGFAMFGLCVYGLKSYGAALFLATPFAMGGTAVMAYRAGRRADPKFRPKMAIGCGFAGLALVGVGLLAMAVEGGGCLAMALIPAAVLSFIGSWLALLVSSADAKTMKQVTSGVFLLPFAAGAETLTETATTHEVTTVVEVAAPPEAVWRRVVAFPDLAPPTELMFRKGIAYPIRARIEGEGVGAVRYCEFSTGSFVEPITVWDAPKRLSFDVAVNPPPMREWSPWDDVQAPHLNGFMQSKRGEFRLSPLPGGRTRLAGTTVYELQIYPALYWKLWTDGIIHTIHGRVLRHIQGLAEADAKATAAR